MPDVPSFPADIAILLGPGSLAERLAFTDGQLALCVVVVFLAGIVRGFSGFALSALIMASLATLVPPVALIPVCFVLEGVASLLMFRGGAREADGRIVVGLAIGSALGMPLGLQATLHLPPDTSRLVALVLILSLAALQLVGGRGAGRNAGQDTGQNGGRSSEQSSGRDGGPSIARAPRWLESPAGLCGTGLLAGVATGLASVGGMIVALHVLAANASAARMRASLVMFLFVGMFTSGAWLIATDVLDRLALVRGLVLALPVAAGVLVGTWLFRPALQGFYRRFCLTLLIGLALAGVSRLLLVGST